MRIGSLFSGIGGLELGLERSIPGAHTVWQVEQNEYARAVLAKHWPEAKRYEDVGEVGAHNLEPVDLICGGFPCQDISVAGKQAGIDGARSGLWSEYARIIGELEPSYVVVENVSALLIGGMGRVLGDLAALGYDAVWDCIPAAAVGAPHRRDRVFLVAYPNRIDTVEQSEPLSRSSDAANPTRDGETWKMANPDSQQQHRNHNGFSRQRGSKAAPSRSIHIGNKGLGGRAEALANPDSAGLERHRTPRDGRQVCPQEAAGLFSRSLRHVTKWKPEPGVGRVATGVPRRVDRLRCLGNAVVPQVAEVVGRVIMDLDNAAV